jgi:nucleotide-binding universal stress UspA family protein
VVTILLERPYAQASSDDDTRGAFVKPIKRIVVGTDFSEVAEKALDEAVDLAAHVGASITLVHAYEFPAFSLPDGVVYGTGDMTKAIASAGLKGLETAVERRKDRGVTIRTVLKLGPPWEEINAVAGAEGADLIVVGTHGRRGFSRVLIGSVAERTLRIATLPVLVIHGDDSKEQPKAV